MKQTLIFFFFFSDQLKMNKDLTKERDQLLTTVEDLREKLNKAITTQQEIETQRDAALENISQVISNVLGTRLSQIFCPASIF